MEIDYGELKIIGWEQGEEDYGDFFIEQVKQFSDNTLKDNINNSIVGIKNLDWALLYNCVHNIKGSSGYAEAQRLGQICDAYQNMLSPYFIKINPNGNTPKEQYQIQNNYKINEQILTLRIFLQLLDEVKLFYKDLKQKSNIEYDIQLLDDYDQQIQNLIQEMQSKYKINQSQHSFERLGSQQKILSSQKSIVEFQKQNSNIGNQISYKQISMTKIDKQISTSKIDKQISTSKIENKTFQKQDTIQNHQLDRPNDSNCCNKCTLI